MVKSVSLSTLTQKGGRPRFWLEGQRPVAAGFVPGARFIVEHVKQGILLKLAELGANGVSKRERSNGRVDAIIDITGEANLKPLEGCTTLRVTIGEGQIYISPIASEQRKARRLARLRDRINSGMQLVTAGIAAGGGVLSHAVHSGLKKALVPARLGVYNEIREDLVEQAIVNNDVITAETVMLNMPLQELAFDESVMSRLGEVDIVELGLPCSGASVAGRAKRKLDMPEAHPDVGHLAAGALAILAKLNPAAIIFENVVPYSNSASAYILRQQLRDLGYEVHEKTMHGPDYGDLEARDRWSMVAVTAGIPFDMDLMGTPTFVERKLKDVMETGEAVESRWSEMTGLKAKQERDIAAGKGFMMQIFTGEESTIKTLTKGICKNRSTDPKIQHPENPDLLRIPTAKEHAAYKGIPYALVEGLSQTTAHEVLGQSITYKAFEWLAQHVGTSLKQWALTASTDIRQLMADIKTSALSEQGQLYKVAA